MNSSAFNFGNAGGNADYAAGSCKNGVVEDFFDGLTLQQQEGEFKYSPLVKELSGIIQLDENCDYKADYTSYLDQKYE